MADWSDWSGREQRGADELGARLAAQWCATFDRDAPADSAMPQGIHLCLCTPEARTGQLAPDGHPVRDDDLSSFLPPVPLPRRMWASSAMQFHAPIAIGARIERTSRVTSITPKSGSRGEMVFVDVDHETHADGTLAVSERQSIVYLEGLTPDAPISPPEPTGETFDPSSWDAHRSLIPDERLLFRYSALTFNTHRIHYDAPFAREVERYRGLVVHGPLTASLLLQLAGAHFGENRLGTFTFRGVSPAIAGETLNLALRGTDGEIEISAFASDGRQVVKASAALG
ncbi:MaoC family dehydratase N-terminal domain-containing protein [Erythrobacter sp.]|uniref:FAS1-like dehydratase domain-containing protein n=1 Tax=Erythrobacter sp. TaxID=1042 RepID=UPI001B1440CF|nr:MaoC family dehydratase N-terminal domain-containing protein [Erythrobacter sp.]MBO6527629.1 MaoC family dehydratase N-terminal domain-containing protein [Erythrobacter sp.]MBO6530116.1 MaoC family dehydratase N-terminal domain-containing protein [Erythrobacter sp.]